MQEELINSLTIDPYICHGKSTSRRLRYPVETYLTLVILFAII